MVFEREFSCWPAPLSHRWAVHWRRWEEHVWQPAQIDSIPGRLQGLPGICGLERETPRPAGRCPPQGGRSGARLWRWGEGRGAGDAGKSETPVSHSCNLISYCFQREELRVAAHGKTNYTTFVMALNSFVERSIVIGRWAHSAVLLFPIIHANT